MSRDAVGWYNWWREMRGLFLVASFFFFFFPMKYVARSLAESAGSGIIGGPEKRQKVGKNSLRE